MVHIYSSAHKEGPSQHTLTIRQTATLKAVKSASPTTRKNRRLFSNPHTYKFQAPGLQIGSLTSRLTLETESCYRYEQMLSLLHCWKRNVLDKCNALRGEAWGLDCKVILWGNVRGATKEVNEPDARDVQLCKVEVVTERPSGHLWM